MSVSLSTDRMRGVFGNLKTECPHCGKPLKLITIELFGKKCDVPCWESCGCEESKLDSYGLDEADKVYARAGIPLKYLKRTPDLRGYQTVVHGGTSLYVWGPNGTGKSTFVANLAKALINMGRSVVFKNSKLLTEEIKQTQLGDTSLLDRCYGADVLIIDDIGKEQPTEYVLSMLYAVIEARYSKDKPLVVASNFARDVLATRWARTDMSTAEAIVSRLCESESLEMGGTDWRLS